MGRPLVELLLMLLMFVRRLIWDEQDSFVQLSESSSTPSRASTGLLLQTGEEANQSQNIPFDVSVVVSTFFLR